MSYLEKAQEVKTNAEAMLLQPLDKQRLQNVVRMIVYANAVLKGASHGQTGNVPA